MGAIFRPPEHDVTYNDEVTYFNRTYYATITITEKRSAPTIQGGRISFFMLSDDNYFILSCYENGKWVVELDPEDDEAIMAQSSFIKTWNRIVPVA